MNEWYRNTEKEIEKSITDEVIPELVLNDQCDLAKKINEKDISGLGIAWALLGVLDGKNSATDSNEIKLVVGRGEGQKWDTSTENGDKGIKPRGILKVDSIVFCEVENNYFSKNWVPRC